jgi:phosphoesterase RecJ-like protein
MSLTTTEQIKHLIDESKHVLITFRKDGKGDAIGSAISLLLYLKKLGKRADIICLDFSLPRQFQFLKQSQAIQPNFSQLQKFIVTIDAKESGVEELSYDIKDEKLRIFITPQTGYFTKNHLKTAQSEFKYNLIFVIDSSDLKSLGEIHEKHIDLFSSIPMVNIDSHPDNEHFADVNLIDVASATTSEIMYKLMKKINESLIDEQISTALLTGIIANTKSFKTENIKPTTLQTASELIDKGADRDFIIKNLFYSKSIASLKLWGQALGHLQNESDIGLVYTTVTKDDINRSGAHKDDIVEIVDELIVNSPDAKITLLLFEDITKNDVYTVNGILVTDKGYDAIDLLKEYNPAGSVNYATFTKINMPLYALLQEIKQQIRIKLTNIK